MGEIKASVTKKVETEHRDERVVPFGIFGLSES